MPESSVLQKRVKFVENDKREGRLLHQPVLLSLPTGMTFGVGAVALNNPVASTMGDAQIAGAGMTLADRITYDVAAKAAHSSEAYSLVKPRMATHKPNARRMEHPIFTRFSLAVAHSSKSRSRQGETVSQRPAATRR